MSAHTPRRLTRLVVTLAFLWSSSSSLLAQTDNPYAVEDQARRLADGRTLRELRDLTEALRKQAKTASDFGRIAELDKRLGNPSARESYELAIAKDPSE